MLVAASVAAALVAAVLVGVSMSRKPTDISGVPGPIRLGVAPSRSLPKSAPLELDQFVVPWGPKDRCSSTSPASPATSHRAGSPVRPTIDCTERRCSADRRSLVYIDDTEHSVRTMAVDGTGDPRCSTACRPGATGPASVLESGRREHPGACSAPEVRTEPADRDDHRRRPRP